MNPNENDDHLPPKLNQLLNDVTRYVSKPLGFNKVNTTVDTKKREVDYASSLPLQVVLYFNVFYSICWIIGSSFLWPVLISRTDRSNRLWIILILFAFILMVIFEIIRLYLGYIGNLSERVPELTGFWLLTLILEVPLSIFLLAIVWVPITDSVSGQSLQIALFMPLQFSLQAVHSLFVFFETIFGFFALRLLARQQISRFHYKQFEMKSLNANDDLDEFYSSNNNYRANSMRYTKYKTSQDWLTNLEKTQNFEMNTMKSKLDPNDPANYGVSHLKEN